MKFTIETKEKFRVADTEDMCVIDLMNKPHDVLALLGANLSEAVSAITRKNVNICWLNIRDEQNPDGNLGFFHIRTDRDII